MRKEAGIGVSVFGWDDGLVGGWVCGVGETHRYGALKNPTHDHHFLYFDWVIKVCNS